MVWVRGDELVSMLKGKIKSITGIPAHKYSLIFSRRTLEEITKLKEYQIQRNSTIILNLRLREGVLGATSTTKETTIGKGMPSFKDILRGKAPT